MLEERNEPRQGCFGSQRREKGGLRERFRGLAQDKLLLPIASLVASLMGSLRVLEKERRSKVWASSSEITGGPFS